MNMRIVFILVGCVMAISVMGQKDYYPRDTTYTIESAWSKMKKSRPDIVAVQTFETDKIKESFNLVYANLENDRQLHGDLFYPIVLDARIPAVVMIHGGGWMRGSKEVLRPMAKALAEMGYLTFAVEYRLGNEAVFPAAIEDIKTAVRWLRLQSDQIPIDTNFIAVYGCSAGGHLASFLGTTGGQKKWNPKGLHVGPSDKVQAVLNIDGIVSFVHPEAYPEWTGKSATAWLGPYSDNLDRWKAASPLEYVDHNSPPFLFVNGHRERFHAGRDDLCEFLNAKDICFEIQMLKNAPHGFWLFEDWFITTRDLTHRFLQRVLQDKCEN